MCGRAQSDRERACGGSLQILGGISRNSADATLAGMCQTRVGSASLQHNAVS